MFDRMLCSALTFHFTRPPIDSDTFAHLTLCRVIYDQLSKDPNSLANLDQDLPNYAQV